MPMATMKVTICSKPFEVRIDDQGVFHAEWNGEGYRAATLEGLKGMLTRQVKRKPLSVPIYVIDEERGDDKLDIEQWIVTGIHSGNGNILAKRAGRSGSAEQLRHYRASILKGSTDMAKLKALYAMTMATRKQYEKFKEANAFDKTVLEDGPEKG